MEKTTRNSSAHLSLFSQEESDVKSTQNGGVPAAVVSDYLKTREALWRLLASYPKGMPVQDAVRRARVDFTKCRKEVAA